MCSSLRAFGHAAEVCTPCDEGIYTGCEDVILAYVNRWSFVLRTFFVYLPDPYASQPRFTIRYLQGWLKRQD